VFFILLESRMTRTSLENGSNGRPCGCNYLIGIVFILLFVRLDFEYSPRPSGGHLDAGGVTGR
jgi:hypothetical protein